MVSDNVVPLIGSKEREKEVRGEAAFSLVNERTVIEKKRKTLKRNFFVSSNAAKIFGS